MTKRSEPVTRWVTPENPTDEQIAEARRALDELAKLLGRASARACYELGITFDMDDPQVARDVMMATFEGLVLSRPSPLSPSPLRRDMPRGATHPAARGRPSPRCPEAAERSA